MAKCQFTTNYWDHESHNEGDYKCPDDEETPGSGICIFHDANYLKEDKEKHIEHEQKVRNKLTDKISEAVARKETLLCIGYYLPDITIKESFAIPVYFTKCNFQGEAQFSGTSFDSTADFKSAVFSEGATFSYARFFGGARFNSAKFLNDIAFFYKTRFCGKITRFNYAEFTGEAKFEAAEFSGETADFSGATFSGKKATSGKHTSLGKRKPTSVQQRSLGKNQTFISAILEME